MARAADKQQQATTAVKHNWISILLVAALVAVATYLVLSTFLGSSKAAVSSIPAQTHIHALLLNGNRLLVGTHNGLYERSSKVEGASWQVNQALPATDVMAFAYQPVPTSVLYAAGHSLGVVVSSDGGANWNNILPGAGNFGNPNDTHALAVDPNDGSLYVWVEKKGLLGSADQGASWQTVNATMSVQVMTLWVEHDSAAKQVIYAGTTAGLLRSDDGGSNWVSINAVQLSGGVYGLSGSSKALYVGTLQGLYQSSDHGNSWQAVAGLPPHGVVGVSIQQGADGHVAVMFNDASIYLSSDNGTSWQAAK